MDLGPETDRLQQTTSSQLRWYLFSRVAVIALFLGGATVYQVRSGTGDFHAALPYLYLLVGGAFLQAFCSAMMLPRIKSVRTFIHVQVTWDLLFVTLIVYFTGCIDSLFSSLYLLVILSSAVFLCRRDVLIVASSAAILYGSLLDLQFYNLLPRFGGITFSEYISGSAALYAVFINVSACYLTALLGGVLSERTRKSEMARHEGEINLVELENLNRTILANISSGLLIINAQGRIRSFNAAAERITGFSLTEVYDRDVRDIFPQLELLKRGRFVIVNRGEASFCNRNGLDLTLGYAATLVKDPKETTVGLLLSFQDLTKMKEMEERLRLSDRLAAVGRLSSGMAHEIRNPLASISGSVQLLMEGEHVTPQDKRLMGIVVKEAERLSQLLSDFLHYARPAPPEFSEVDLSSMLSELIEMAHTDPRFVGIEIVKCFPDQYMASIDYKQIHQAIWNLVINAAEAMDGKGRLVVGINPDEGRVFIEDSGPGITDETRDKVFEPFFTTKDKGTGLGLATVYNIVESHGAKIKIHSGPDGGTRFEICLPVQKRVGEEEAI